MPEPEVVVKRAWAVLAALAVALGTVGLAGTSAVAAPSRTVGVHVETTSGADVVLHEVAMRSTASSPGTYAGTRWTNGLGRAAFPRVPRGTFVLEVTVPSASGPVTVRRQVAVGSSDVDVTLRPRVDAALHGKVLRGAGAVPDAWVSARRAAGTTWSPTTRTAPNGAWVLTDRSPGRYVLKADSWGTRFLTTYSGDTVREPDARAVAVVQGGATRVVVRTVAAAFLSGRVVDGHGKPVAGVFVHADNLDRYGSADAVTGVDGRYRLSGLATGRVRVDVLDEHFTLLARTTVDARQGSVVAVRTLRATRSSGAMAGASADLWAGGVRPTSGVAVGGVVRHAGRGVVGVQVVVGTAQGAVSARVTTDDEGRYRVPGVPAGSWRVYVRDPYTGGYRDASRAVTVGAQSVAVPPITVS
ncbi:carboxypeptidase regulatory-like domain-containing protein [Cellulomonas sp. DKR-3]|uniref:Carboxypeptidase regulatory-like domain-containing protein n=1 Tax=Cellulomonas fulva TaxID=2835530 RepID=A0ABS5TWE3_9CELL|nr:carboxypeptidase-like regulatory domain-containing protein [Cellulomonas fulva]MBT0993479.1 carboxypeptidase regulatory-like domain-containing protein [Cellulomonas fulva]